jgi:hypothetical protein
VQIPECCAKKRNCDRNAKSCTKHDTPAPKKSGVIQLQCTNFPKKSSESSKDSEYSDDSDHSDDSNDSDDNIGSDSDSCACDEEGERDYHFIQWARVDFFSRNHALANVSGKK